MTLNSTDPRRQSELPTAGHWRVEAWATLKLALPLAAAQLAQVAMHTTDVVMMGWLGPEALAGGTLGSSLLFPIFLLGMGVVMATAPLAAQALGARKFREVRRSVRQGFWWSVVLAVPFTLLLWHGEAILLLLRQDPANAALGQEYLRPAVWCLAPGWGVIVLRGFVSVHDRPRSVMVVTVAGFFVNAVTDYLLIFGKFGFPALGVAGAGVATTVVNTLMFLALCLYVVRDRRFRRYALLARFWRADWPRFREILRIGMPIGLTVLAEAGLFSAAAFLMGMIGTAELAAHAIALQCAAVAFMVPLGIGHAATVRVGLAVGAGDPAGIGRAGWSALALAAGFSALPITLFLAAPTILIGLFLDVGDPANAPAIGIAVSFLAVAALFNLVDGAQAVATGILRGLKDTTVPMLIAAGGYWLVGFTTSFVLGFYTPLAGIGVWLGLAGGLAVVSVLAIHRFHFRDRLMPGLVPSASGG
ncbi:MAG: MATE family efflux transporter [Inquilinus sp.]|nr:MATE family efflux transporter [Inquilinus sp.]